MLLLASCGKFTKKVTREQVQDRSVVTTIDTSETVITNELDTSFHVPGVNMELDMNINDTCNDSVITRSITDTATGTTLTVIHDKKTGKISAKVEKSADTIPVKFRQTIKTKNGITRTEQRNITTDTYKKEKVREPWKPNYLMIGFSICALLAVVWVIRQVYK